jgi:hypothetical protein
MAATEEFEEAQVTLLVRSCRDPSVYLPVAVNCWLVPTTKVEFIGRTTTATSKGAVTVS